MLSSPLPRLIECPKEKDVMYFECGDWLYRVECIRPMLGSSAPYTYLISCHPEVQENMPKNPSVALYWKDVYRYRSLHAPDSLDAYAEAFELVDADYRMEHDVGRTVAGEGGSLRLTAQGRRRGREL